MGIDLPSVMPAMVALIALAAFFTSMLTAMVGAGGGTALLLLMLYVMPAGQVVPVHGGIQLVSNLTRVVLFWRHMHRPAILRFVIPMPAGVYLGLELHGLLSAAGLQLVIAGFALVGFSFAPHAPTIICAALATVAGTHIGKKLLAGLSSRRFTTLFRIVLALLAAKLVWDALQGPMMS